MSALNPFGPVSGNNPRNPLDDGYRMYLRALTWYYTDHSRHFPILFHFPKAQLSLLFRQHYGST